MGGDDNRALGRLLVGGRARAPRDRARARGANRADSRLSSSRRCRSARAARHRRALRAPGRGVRGGARGGNVIVTTGTASGKTLAFNLPVLDALAADRHARALYLYPTKALAQDQARSLARARRPRRPRRDLRRRHADRAAPPDPRLGEPRAHEPGHAPHRRPAAARPVGRLPPQPPLRRRGRGARLPRRLRLARRERPAAAAPARADLRRRAAVPARLGDDRERRRARARAHGRGGDGRRGRRGAARRADDRALEPAAARRRARDPRERARRGVAAARRARRAAACGRSASRRAASRPSSSTASPADRLDAATAARLAPYRAGYTPQQRREIERRLVEGELLGVTSTDALELGIDIGDLDCAISVGFPGTVASLRQQWGRAGRREHGLAILVASEDALDQYFMREPPALLERRVEAAILDHANPRVLDGHVAAAAFEAPVDEGDAATLGPEALERAPHVPELRHTPRGWVWAGKDSPAARTPLRSTSPDAFLVVDAVERRRARPGRAGARVLHRPRGRRLPPPRPPVPRPRARPPGAARGRRAVRRRLVHAGEEGDGDVRSRSRCASSGGSASSSPSAASR